MLRLNVAVEPCTADCSVLGVMGGDLAGFPNGRRLTDDVTDIEIRAVLDGYGSFINGLFGDLTPNNSPNNLARRWGQRERPAVPGDLPVPGRPALRLRPRAPRGRIADDAVAGVIVASLSVVHSARAAVSGPPPAPIHPRSTRFEDSTHDSTTRDRAPRRRRADRPRGTLVAWLSGLATQPARDRLAAAASGSRCRGAAPRRRHHRRAERRDQRRRRRWRCSAWPSCSWRARRPTPPTTRAPRLRSSARSSSSPTTSRR